MSLSNEAKVKIALEIWAFARLCVFFLLASLVAYFCFLFDYGHGVPVLEKFVAFGHYLPLFVVPAVILLFAVMVYSHDYASANETK